jgi:glutathione synthase/RimK-type ligase-like ATP-grasp enzyme
MILEDRYKIHERIMDIKIQIDDKKIVAPLTQKTNNLNDTNLSYPQILKPLNADGKSYSHNLKILYQSIDQILNEPIIKQQYYDHSPYIYKIYIVGDRIYQEFYISATYKLNKSDNHTNLIDISRNNANQPLCDQIKIPPLLLDELIREIKHRFQVSLLGIDLIYNQNTYYIIDINYFPSYSRIPNLTDQFHHYFEWTTRQHQK